MKILLEMSLRAEALSIQQHLLDKDYDVKLYAAVQPEWKFVNSRDQLQGIWLYAVKDGQKTLIRLHDIDAARKYYIYVPNVFMPPGKARSWMATITTESFQEIKDNLF